jgi:V-type H+-transporting ATPase subunit C
VQTDRKRSEKARKGMDSSFSYLAGNAFGRDSKGRVKKDEGMGGSGADLVAGAGGDAGGASGGDYAAFVCFEIDVD